MPDAPTLSPPSSWGWTLLLCIGLPLMALLALGQDTNWDLLNYHLYNPFAWLHGRLTQDIAPAQMQSWHNPLLDVPLYWMVGAHWPGLLVGFWLTLPAMAAICALLRIHALVSTYPGARLETAALAVLATGGVAFLAEIGTCFDDAFVAAGVLASLYLVLREGPAADRLWVWCLAGVLAGATAGLKLTATTYCLGLAAAAIAMPPLHRAPRRAFALLLGGTAGLALTFAWWGTLLLHLHGNPVFPYFNQFFHSPDALPLAYGDDRFKPHGPVDGLLTPVHLLFASQHYSEMKLRDPRLLLGVVAFAALPWMSHGIDPEGDAVRRARLRALAGFFLVSLYLWAFQYGVYRYVMPLEMLGCLGLLLGLEGLPEKRRLGGTVIAGLAVVAMTFPASWGRSHFRPEFVSVRMPALPSGSMVVISSQSPLAFAVTALPDSVPAIALQDNFMQPHQCTRLMAEAEHRVAAHRGPLWLLRGSDAPDDDGQAIAAKDFGLHVSVPCLPVTTNLGALLLCPLHRDPNPPTCALPASATGR